MATDFQPRSEHIRGLFTRIARIYDPLNRALTLGIDLSWRRRALRRLAAVGEPAALLDLATGTADLAIGAARRFPRARVVGIDLTPAMLAVGAGKVAKAGLSERIELREGNAQSLDFPDAAFDAVTCAFGFRNFSDVAAALAESCRVLKPGGTLLVLELFRMKSRFFAGFTSAWLRCVAPWFARGARSDYAYLRASIEHTLVVDEFRRVAETVGFKWESDQFFRPSCHCLVLRKYDRIMP